MRVLLHSLCLSLLCGYVVSCGSPDPMLTAQYPKNGFSGDNILYEGLSVLDSTHTYSMIAELDRGMLLKVVLTNTSAVLPRYANDTIGSYWTYNELRNTGWFVMDYDFATQSQIFYAEGPATPHIELDFEGCGTMTVDVYENGSKKVASSKSVSWETFCNP
ncbi:hypothetical protein GC194_03745 [bacterium]|nr:hypothetical protein [bacterium]